MRRSTRRTKATALLSLAVCLSLAVHHRGISSASGGAGDDLTSSSSRLLLSQNSDGLVPSSDVAPPAGGSFSNTAATLGRRGSSDDVVVKQPTTPLSSTGAPRQRRLLSEGSGGEAKEAESFMESKLFNGLVSLFLVCVAGTMAGLTMGLLGMDPIELEVAKNSGGSEEERVQAEKVWTVVSQHHRLLVTLLLFNALANEALPIFLDALVPPFAAILASVTLVLVFGEILPAAIFTGPSQLKLAAKMVGNLLGGGPNSFLVAAACTCGESL